MSLRTHHILNIVLAILYIPISFFGFLLGMATEGTIGETNPLIIASCYTVAIPGMLTPITAYGGLLLSHRLFDKGRIRESHYARFLGLIILVTACILCVLLDWLSCFLG